MHPTPPPSQKRLPAAVGCFLAGTGLTAFALQSVLSEFAAASQFLSRVWWSGLLTALGYDVGPTAEFVELDPLHLMVVLAPGSLILWLLGAGWITLWRREPFRPALADWGIRGWSWWLIPGGWEIARVLATWGGAEGLLAFLSQSAPFWFTVPAAGWLAVLLTLSSRSAGTDQARAVSDENGASTNRSGVPPGVWILLAVYAVVFTAMNWQLYRGLHVPHGDSAMYEEHLWNFAHGKGFRSYLDRGLFLGEHLQVVHLLLTPVYLLWQSHLLLELCESLVLAAGALPVYWMACRHCGSRRAGLLLAAAYLLYFPLHFLDIAIDLKTFRPNSFGVPLLLFAIDQLERRRYRSMGLLLLLTLTAKEDFAVMIALVGVWLVLFPPQEGEATVERRNVRLLGAGLAAFGVVYLFLAVQFIIPWFRAGEVHYAQYFGELGNTPGDILRSMFTEPGLVLGKLFSLRSLMYLLLLLAPLGFLPVCSPSRLAAALPLFGVLCLLELSSDPADRGQSLVPWHHFHAPLIPVLFWSAAAGLGNVANAIKRSPPEVAARFAFASAVATGFVFGFSPAGRMFWDPGSSRYWKALYVPGERAEKFAEVFKLIPRDSRVASTDFVHTRFTHHERSYDYSKYPRAVNDNRPGAPPDTDYIVIDTQSRYSEISTPEQIPEYAEDPQEWEIVRHGAEDYFIVLKRKQHD